MVGRGIRVVAQHGESAEFDAGCGEEKDKSDDDGEFNGVGALSTTCDGSTARRIETMLK
jgi:hypothetical protein